MKSIINIAFLMWYLLVANTTSAFSHADTLRGSNGPGRSWWDVQHYMLDVKFDTASRTITGVNTITLLVTEIPHDSMQIDLQDNMVLDKAEWNNTPLPVTKEGNVWWLKYPFSKWTSDAIEKITLYYHGSPRIAKNPPWDGGFIWTRDANNNPWIAVACQGLGASVWWPCKDVQWDEPDKGMDMYFTVPVGLTCVSNGRMPEKNITEGSYTKWHWQELNPVNNYDVTFYIGDYVHWSDTLMGEKGKLSLDYYVLSYNEAKARRQFEEVKPMLHCFEYWMGPYPFYEDGYKLVEAPYLGMEHQSAVAYGNKYLMGYLGRDRSGSGQGKKFDYIIVHESGHEWFGNSVTAKDIADNWVQEGITTYSETLYAECLLGKIAANEYCHGEWNNIINNKPIIGPYGVNEEGSNDMYDKGAAIMYMIRARINNDTLFHNILRGISAKFYHRTVTTKEVEQYITEQSHIDFGAFFDQYLRTTDIPELEYYIKDNELYYRFNNIVNGFTLPISVNGHKKAAVISPGAEWQHISWKGGGYNVSFSKDYLIQVKI